MVNNFIWNDKNVADFAMYWRDKNAPYSKDYVQQAIDNFKFIKSKESKPIQDWEIIEFRSSNDDENPFNRWHKIYDNAYQTCKYAEVFTLHDMLIGTHANVKNGLIKIYSVLRISDSKVFTVKDVTNYGIIEKFYIGWAGMEVHFTNGIGATLNSIEHKQKDLILTTEDGINIFNDFDGFIYWVDIKHWHQLHCTIKQYKEHDHIKYFSTEKKAIDYIEANKPITISFKELSSLLPDTFTSTKNYLRKIFKSKINNG